VERWTRPDLGHLHLELLIEDPKFYKQPIHFQRGWVLAAGRQTREEACTENNIDVFSGHLRPGPGAIRAERHTGVRQSGTATAASLEIEPCPNNSAAGRSLAKKRGDFFVRFKFGLFAGVVGLLMSVQQAGAHHSLAAEFDGTKAVRLVGS
jgi:hypothetical protein